MRAKLENLQEIVDALSDGQLLPAQKGRQMITLKKVVKFLVENGPGRTAEELAEAIFVDAGYQKRINQDCKMMCNSGEMECRGTGGHADPYRYYPTSK